MAKAKTKEEKPLRRLTGLQELFCQRYTTHWNATRAAKEAGYSDKAASEQGYALLQIDSVKARIKVLSEHVMKEIGVTRERVLQELSRIAFLDPKEAFDETGKLLHVKDMPEDVRRALHKTETFYESSPDSEGKEMVTGTTTKLEWSPKKPALDSLGKVLGISPDKFELTGKDGKPIEFRDLSKLTDEQLEALLVEKLANASIQTKGKKK